MEPRVLRNIVGGKPLEDALDAMGGAVLTPKVVGKWLVALDGRIVDGWCLRRHATIGHSTKFSLQPAGEAGGAGQ